MDDVVVSFTKDKSKEYKQQIEHALATKNEVTIATGENSCKLSRYGIFTYITAEEAVLFDFRSWTVKFTGVRQAEPAMIHLTGEYGFNLVLWNGVYAGLDSSLNGKEKFYIILKEPAVVRLMSLVRSLMKKCSVYLAKTIREELGVGYRYYRCSAQRYDINITLVTYCGLIESAVIIFESKLFMNEDVEEIL